jgi:hypothetical protein
LEDYPRYREGGRLQNYRRDLSDGAVAVLHKLVYLAAGNLEGFDTRQRGESAPRDRGLLVLSLTRLTLVELAAPAAGNFLRQAFQHLQSL